MNLFADNRDLRYHFESGIDWPAIVPLWEPGFRDPEGPGSSDEAHAVYLESLRELGDYAAREVAPRAREIDEQGVGFDGAHVLQPEALLKNIAGLRRLGVMAVSLPRAHGGHNFPYSVSAACLEILGRACTNTMVLYAFYQAPALLLLRFGTPHQIQQWVPGLAAGEYSGAVAMTEPEAGSDLGRIATQARPHGDPDEFSLDGRKQFVTNGCGDVCLVLARSEPDVTGLAGLSLFEVPREQQGRPNYRVARPEKKATLRGSATCELHFEGAQARLLGRRAAGFAQMLTFMNEARVAVGLQALGLCEDALDRARRYAHERVQLGRPIARHALLADLLVDMQVEVAALRALIYRTTAAQDRLFGLERLGRPEDAAERARLAREVRERTPLVKWLGAERALWVARSAVQVHGGYGVVQEYEVERAYRNALILPIYEGTSQIQALMALKDQLRWTFERPWRLAGTALPVEAPHDPLGDGVRAMAAECGQALARLARRALGWRALLGGARAARAIPEARLDSVLVHAERLVEMLAWTRAAEALAAHAPRSSEHRAWAERLVQRRLPRVVELGHIIRLETRLGPLVAAAVGEAATPRGPGAPAREGDLGAA